MRAAWLIGAGLLAAAAVWWRAPLLRWLEGDRDRPASPGGGRITGMPAGDAGAADRPAPPAGDPTFIELRALAPAARYLDRLEDDGADAAYRAAVQSVGRRDVVYDPHLGRAARELAAQRATGLTPPEAALSFFLHSAGAPDANAGQYLLATSDDRNEVIAEAVVDALAGAPPGAGLLLVGIGEASAEGERMSRHLAVVMARRDYELEPVARRLEPGATAVLRGHLPAGYAGAHGVALYPDGRIVELPVSTGGSRFTLQVPAGDQRGGLEVGIDGVGRDGPGKLLQLTLSVGVDPPRALNVDLPPADPALADGAAAEAWALELLQRDRDRHGLPRFTADAGLTAIARRHSADMRDRGFFGHRSPGTGLLGDRLRTAGYRASAHGENLARNDTLGEAQASLMSSVGHRKNVLEPSFTHAGVGVVSVDHGGRRDWMVTQVFARKVTPIDTVAARERLLAAINAARAAAGAGPLAPEAALAAAAQRGARTAAGGALDGLAARIGDEVRPLVSAGAAIGIQAIYDLDQFEVPKMALDGDMDEIGIGIEQSTDDPAGRIGVVLVVAR